MMASRVLVASSTLPCRTSLAAATTFSLANRVSFLLASIACSRSMPMKTFNFWKSSILTPFAFSSTNALKMEAMASSVRVKLNSVLAYFLISVFPMTPDLAYFLNIFSMTSIFAFASTFFFAFSTADLQEKEDCSTCREHSLILANNSDRESGFSPSVTSACLLSETRITAPLSRTMSVQALIFSFAACTTFSTPSASSFRSSRSTAERSSCSRIFFASSAAAFCPSSAASTRALSSFKTSWALACAACSCLLISFKCSRR
mmetsp:Transcript_2825/g.6818  ORF Transcript_2825/g.6818 Transcript_2825/m.6818 type:complete len:261 (+) Transcript_2825:1263-2045(+)